MSQQKYFPLDKFMAPAELLRRLGVTSDVVAYALNWQPVGDEVEFTARYETGLIEQSVGMVDNWAWLELERLNLSLFRRYNFGNSEEEAEYAIFGDNKMFFYVVPYRDVIGILQDYRSGRFPKQKD